jgi:bifunctional non-homologous end joining protein LigD
VLWSWAVPKGPSLDPGDKRLAVHVEDHPLDYADFHGVIPPGQYGAGTVETWDRGTWAPVGDDPAADLARGELKFVLTGKRLNGGFVLVRLKPRPSERAENWLLIKERDDQVRPGATADALEAVPPPRARGGSRTLRETRPMPGAVKAPMPEKQEPQLAELARAAPEGDAWLSEIKFDGYRLLAFLSGGKARVVSRNGVDWTDRLPGLAAAFAGIGAREAVIDGEMVALDGAGRSDFSKLKDILSAKRDAGIVFQAFDLLYRDGFDLRPCRLLDRKAALRELSDWRGLLRYSDHVVGRAGELHQTACGRHIEGIICKRADAPYRPGRGTTWLKVKCEGREEFVVLGWTPPKGSRTGLGALHMGFYDGEGRLHYAGGVGTGFSDHELTTLRRRLDGLAERQPPGLEAGVEPIARDVRWVRPELVAEIRYLAFTGAGRLRHATYLGLREDKEARDVVRDPPEATGEADSDERPEPTPAAGSTRRRGGVVVARPPGTAALSHPDKELWPGITKQDLADYWRAVADAALPGIARRPLALVRCPDGIGGQHFFQKHEMKGFPAALRAADADGAPYIALDDAAGLAAMAQLAAIELHVWGATEADPLHPDQLVFDLDPGEGIGMAELAAAALDVRDRLAARGMAAFCRTSGGKGLHVVTPLVPGADWDTARAWSRSFAEAMARDAPDRYVAAVKKSIRDNKILVDWLRNGLGSTAIASFSPRARDGAGVATPLAWRDVTAGLRREAFTLRTVPERLRRQRSDPWAGFRDAAVRLEPLS